MNRIGEQIDDHKQRPKLLCKRPGPGAKKSAGRWKPVLATENEDPANIATNRTTKTLRNVVFRFA